MVENSSNSAKENNYKRDPYSVHGVKKHTTSMAKQNVIIVITIKNYDE
jgi:hypothetical protein